MKKLFFASAAVSALLLGACTEEPEVVEVDDTGLEEPVEPVVEPVAYDWDTNDDGIFQEAEYSTWDQQGISAWDNDADGQLSSEEFDTNWTVVGFTDPNTVFTAWDDDSDGFLTDDEFFDDEEWDEWDTDDSGILETGEFAY